MKAYYKLHIADLLFAVTSERVLPISPVLGPFLDQEGGRERLEVEVSWNFQAAPAIKTAPLGGDRVQRYYRQEGGDLCVLTEGEKGLLSVTRCDEAYRHFACFINEAPFLETPRSLGFVLRMLPMRTILQRHGITFFHAAQIALGQTGILFTAPSGVGKTTQARLWQRYRGARIVCNDRVLVKHGWTYGFPLDGSEPVGSSEENQLGAIVVLRQAHRDRVERLRPSQALGRLIPQLVVDAWDSKARELGTGQLLSLIEATPIYELECTPTEAAVECLEQRLKEDGVI